MNSITVVGLGPSGLDLVPEQHRAILTDPGAVVILRTAKHPAARGLAEVRDVVTCDDLYDSLPEFDAVYQAITDRIMAAVAEGPVVYAVPGSAVVGERAVGRIREAAAERGVELVVLASLSFLDLAYGAVDLDPIADGLQVVDARDLPDPLPLHLPTIVTQVDSRLRASDLSVALGRTLPSDHPLTILDRLGDPDEVVEMSTVSDLARYEAGERCSVFVDTTPVGLLGLVATNRILRAECPWDHKQTHHTLVTHLIEEAYETVDAIGRLSAAAPAGEVDYGAYAEVEEELGDLLLQVVFHATLASESGAFDLDEVAEGIRRKLVARHPHVFGDVQVAGADEVLANWEQLKQDEKQRGSLMDDVPVGMPAMARAMKLQKRASSVGFDWDLPAAVFSVLESEIAELASAATPAERTHELGDVLFSAINLARHLDVDPEVALRSSADRFDSRFRAIEADLARQGLDVSGASDVVLAEAWERAKSRTEGSDAKQ